LFRVAAKLALVGKVTTGMGLACFLMVLASSPGRDRLIIAIYAFVTTLIGIAFVLAGRVPRARATPIEVEPELVPSSDNNSCNHEG